MTPSFLLRIAVLAPLLPPALAGQPGETQTEGEFLVCTATAADAQALANEHGLVVIDGLAETGVYLLRSPLQMDPEEELEMLAELHADPVTFFAEPNHLFMPPELTGCGPSVSIGAQQCTIAFYDGDHTPEEYYDQPAVPAIRATEAQQHLNGDLVTVAVVDTGIDPAHPLLVGRLHSLGYDFIEDQAGAIDVADGIDNDSDWMVDEAFGHGTHVSTTITLINPSARILPLRVLDSDGNGTAFAVAEAIHHAVGAGARVVNLSLGMSGRSETVVEALEYARALDVTVVSSAGNTGGKVLFPARYRPVLAVAATDASDVKASFSAFGKRVDICAPGVEIYAGMPGGLYARWSGTSMAAAIGSGAISLLHVVGEDEENGDDGDSLKVALKEGAVDIDPKNPDFATLLGRGRIDLLESVEQLD